MMERSVPMRFGSKLEVTKVTLSRWSFIGDRFGEDIGDLEKQTWK